MMNGAGDENGYDFNIINELVTLDVHDQDKYD